MVAAWLFSEGQEYEKKNFYTTLQLVTLSDVKLYVPGICSGDSFRFTHHPLVTITQHIILIQNELQSQFTHHP